MDDNMCNDLMITMIDRILELSEYIDHDRCMSKKDYKKRIKYLKKVKKKIEKGELYAYSKERKYP